jgi:hypothetical protein
MRGRSRSLPVGITRHGGPWGGFDVGLQVAGHRKRRWVRTLAQALRVRALLETVMLGGRRRAPMP